MAIAVNGANKTLVAGSLSYGIPSTNADLDFWDGNQWSVLGKFTGGSSALIYDSAYVGNTLYAAGTFNMVNGTAATGLARWDGTGWSSVGFNGTAVCLAKSGNDLYVGGLFTNVDNFGTVMTNIGRWDGSAWHALGAGLGAPSYGFARCLVVNGSTLYAGGQFINSGALLVTNLAMWDGSTWSSVGGGANGVVYGLALNGGNLYAGGAFTQVGATAANYVAQWDGANWTPLGTGLGGAANSVAVFNNQVCAVGAFTSAGGIVASNFAIWNGASWSAAGPGLSSTGYRVVSNGTNVYVGGAFGLAGGLYTPGVAAWDGINWSGVGPVGRCNGLSSSVLAVANDGTNLYAGGLFTYSGKTNASLVAGFDGTNWFSLGTGIGPVGGTTTVRAVAVNSNNVYVGGSFSTAGGISALNIARWDGTNWNALGNGPGGAVASITVRTEGVYAAGAPVSGVNYGSPFFSRWDGTNWLGALNYNVNNTFLAFYITDANIGMDAVAFSGTNIYVGGHFRITQYDPNVIPSVYTNCNNIMRFDGTYGEIMGTGLNSNVIAMAVLDTNLYVAGLFTNAGGISASHIAKWDGNTWSAVGSGVIGSGSISTLLAIGTNLYAGGSFTNIGGVTASRLAKWDGANWSALGSGMSSGTVLGLTALGTDLFAGGSFRAAGGRASYFLGHWNDLINFHTPQLLNPTALGDGRFRMRLYGVPGQTNIIQATTNYASWVPVLTNSAGIYDFTDPSAANYPNRFYRAMLGP